MSIVCKRNVDEVASRVETAVVYQHTMMYMTSASIVQKSVAACFSPHDSRDVVAAAAVRRVETMYHKRHVTQAGATVVVDIVHCECSEQRHGPLNKVADAD